MGDGEQGEEEQGAEEQPPPPAPEIGPAHPAELREQGDRHREQGDEEDYGGKLHANETPSQALRSRRSQPLGSWTYRCAAAAAAEDRVMASRTLTVSGSAGVAGRLRARLARLSAALETAADRERDQLPLWLPVGMLAGIAAWFHIGTAAGWAGFLCLAAAAALGLAVIAGRSRWGRALAIFALAAALGCGNIWW